MASRAARPRLTASTGVVKKATRKWVPIQQRVNPGVACALRAVPPPPFPKVQKGRLCASKPYLLPLRKGSVKKGSRPAPLAPTVGFLDKVRRPQWTQPPIKVGRTLPFDPSVALCGPVSGRAQVEAAVANRRVLGIWRLPAFASHGDRRLFHRLNKVAALAEALPPVAVTIVLGTEAQVSPEESRALLQRLLEAKAGPEGEAVAKATKCLRLLAERASRDSLPNGGLPASSALIASIVAAEGRRAALAAVGTQGGRTVAGTVREGFLFLQKTLGLPIEADCLLVEAVAAPPPGSADVQGGRSVAHAASLPLGVLCQLEWVASLPDWSVPRVVARALLCTAAAHGIRCNDALNAVVWLEGDLLVGRTTVRSKDSMPLPLYAPAAGLLGQWHWAAEHVAEMEPRGHSIPDYSASAPSRATALAPGVLPKRKVLDALRDICAMPPLRMTAQEFSDASITGHSFHGTPADLVRFMGTEAGFTFPADARAAGHWLRDKSEAAPVQHRGARAQPAGAPNARGAMDNRYTGGAGRRGEREEQISIRTRITAAVRGALETCGTPWYRLPRSLASWDILRRAA